MVGEKEERGNAAKEIRRKQTLFPDKTRNELKGGRKVQWRNKWKTGYSFSKKQDSRWIQNMRNVKQISNLMTVSVAGDNRDVYCAGPLTLH